MKTDLYTKVMLTVIAACLVWLCLGGPALLTPVAAQNQDQRVILVGWTDWAEAGKGGGVHGMSAYPLPVKLDQP